MQKKKSNMPKLIVSVLVVMAVVAAQYFVSDDYHGTELPSEAPSFVTSGIDFNYDYNSNASFYSSDSKNFFFCTKDGLKYVANTGVVKWNEIFNMTSPIMIGESEIVAVSEERGRAVYVFSTEGKLYEKRFEYPIISFSINKNGFLSVILLKNDSYEISVYYKDDDQPILHGIYTDYNVFPVASDISDDGKILVVSFLDINGATPNSKLVFTYLENSSSKNYRDGTFAYKEKSNQIIPTVKFMDNNDLITVSDAEIMCYAVGENNTVTDKWAMSMKNAISKIAFLSSRYFAISLGDSLLNKEGETPGLVRIYNLSGGKTGEYYFDEKITYMYTGWNSVIIGSGKKYAAISDRGGELWRYDATQDVRQIIFLDNTNTILVAANSHAEVFKKPR